MNRMSGMDMADTRRGTEPVLIHSNARRKEVDEVVGEEGIVLMDGAVDCVSNARDLAEWQRGRRSEFGGEVV